MTSYLYDCRNPFSYISGERKTSIWSYIQCTIYGVKSFSFLGERYISLHDHLLKQERIKCLSTYNNYYEQEQTSNPTPQHILSFIQIH